MRHASRTDDSGVRMVVAVGATDPGLPDYAQEVRILAFSQLCRRGTDAQLGTRRGSLGPQNGPLAGKDGARARASGPGEEPRRLVRSDFSLFKRQSRL